MRKMYEQLHLRVNEKKTEAHHQTRGGQGMTQIAEQMRIYLRG